MWTENDPFHLITLKSHSVFKENQNRNSKQKLRGKSWSRSHEERCYGLAPQSFLSLLSYSIQGQQFREGTTCNRLGPPTSIPDKKMPRGFVYRLTWCEHLLNCTSFFSTNSGLWQTGKWSTRTKHFPVSQIKLHVKNTFYIKLVSQHIASKLTTNMWEFLLLSYPQSILFYFKMTVSVPKCTPC